jgi:signal transduction histidine kinase
MRRSIALEAGHVEAVQGTLDRLRLEVAELRTSRKRLALAADADRRRIERDLHDGVRQHLVALAVNLQLMGRLADADPAAARALLDEMSDHVQQALDETVQLAQWIYPPLLEAGGLAVALRSAAASIGVTVSVEVAAGGRYPHEVAAAVYWCFLETLERAGAGAQATIIVRDDAGALAFEIAEDGDHPEVELEPLRDRVEALGGELTIRSQPGRGTRVSGALPLSG